MNAHLLLALLSSSSVAAATPAPEALPSLFAPIRWSDAIADVQRAFPGHEAEVTDQSTPERKLVLFSGLRLPTIGDAQLTAVFSPGGELLLVDLSTDDYRPACRLSGRDPETISRRLDCRWRRGPSLLRGYRALEKRLVAIYGRPGSRYQDRSGARSLGWKRSGYRLSLVLDKGDDGMWSARVQAYRPGWDAE